MHKWISKLKAYRAPDFRNLGVHIRIVILLNILAVLFNIAQNPSLTEALTDFIEASFILQPILLASLLLLFFVAMRWEKWPAYWRLALIFAIPLTVAWLVLGWANWLLPTANWPELSRMWLWAVLSIVLLLYYFSQRHRALSPALAEARLQALQARIRPHFLFNCINGVLSIMRSDPKRAETALEDMADLFRMLMAENQDLVPLASEIALCRQYLALEKLRLEDRLNIIWRVEHMPPDAMIPPLLLQPLLENAVYHGIEPMPEGGDVWVNISVKQQRIHISLRNPLPQQGGHHTGNKMALNNIRERLALHFDAEASLDKKIHNGYYEVNIQIPYYAH